MKAKHARFEKDAHYLGWLTKLHQTDIVEDFIVVFKFDIDLGLILILIII
jgi:hypothetical protein